jgi:hypothetical protein
VAVGALSSAAYPRGTTNTNARGNSAMRRWRKLMLLERDGDGHTARCHEPECRRLVDYYSMVVDCHPIPRVEGGTYDLKSTKQPEESNNKIHCVPCSHSQGGKLGTERKRAKAAAAVAELAVSFDVS